MSEGAIIPQATLDRYHADQKAFFATQTAFNTRILDMLAERQRADDKLEARLDAGTKTFEHLREKIAELKPVPIPWTQKLAVAVAGLGLIGGAAVVLIRAPSADDYERLRQEQITLKMEQVRDRAVIELRCPALVKP